MKFLAIFALALLGSTTAFQFGELTHRDVEIPIIAEPEGRIINGKQASVGQFPYQVGLSLKVSAVSSSWCGGSVLSDKSVLTAAHCADGIQSATVYFGAVERTKPEFTRTVEKKNIIIHSGWNSQTLRNDIAILKFSEAIKTSGTVQLTKLPTSATTYTNQKAIASGWGRTSDSSNAVASHLMYAQVNVAPGTTCSSVYGTSVFTSGNVCVETKSTGTSTCNGDSGGPLVLEGTKVQIGLTSYGAAAGCAKGYPVVFTNVSQYLSWINANK